HVLLVRRDQHDVARLNRNFAALGNRRARTLQDVDAFLEAVVQMRTARRGAVLWHCNFGDAERHIRADCARHRFERGAPRHAELLRLILLEQSRHQLTCRSCLISRGAPCTASSCRKMSPASLAMASAISVSILLPFSAVACCGLPNQPVGAIE